MEKVEIEKKKIVVIDDSPSNLQIILSALKQYFHIIPFTSGLEAINAFSGGLTCNLILLDIEIPEFDGFDVIRVLKSMPGVKNIPVIFLTGRLGSESEMHGLSLGAVDYIYKPFKPTLVKKRIDIHLKLEEYSRGLEQLVEEKTRTIEKLSRVTVETILSIMGRRDSETKGHISRTSAYVVALANELFRQGLYTEELTAEKIYLLRRSAPLHDVGKIAISDTVLKKPGRLTVEEFEEMKQHTVIGRDAFREAVRLMEEESFLNIAEILAYSHHERWDGKGYPQGLKGEEIPLYARIMAIADVYDALISKRIYKEPMSHAEAVKIIMEGKGTQFAPDICQAFYHIHAEFNRIAQQFKDEDDIGGGN